MTVIDIILAGGVLGFLGLSLWSGIHGDPNWRLFTILANLSSVIFNGIAIVTDITGGSWGLTGFNIWGVCIGVFVLWVLMRDRRGKKKVKKWLGAKSKALRDALVRKVRELAPGPVPRLVPVGEQ